MTFSRARVAALTMAYNEPYWLPIWVRHHARQVGPENVYVLDHGSDDGSTEALPAQVIRLPRTPLDEARRTRQVQDAVGGLLARYDWVVHTDADELLLPVPGAARTLAEFAATCSASAITALGLDLQHLPDEEPALGSGSPLGSQRRWARFAASMCKPALVREPVSWAPGFHHCDQPRVWGRLLLLHLRYADLTLGLRRLARTRALAFAEPGQNPHQRVSDAEFADMVRRIAMLPRQQGVTLDPFLPPASAWIARLDGAPQMDLSLAGDMLWELPASVRTLLPGTPDP